MAALCPHGKPKTICYSCKHGDLPVVAPPLRSNCNCARCRAQRAERSRLLSTRKPPPMQGLQAEYSRLFWLGKAFVRIGLETVLMRREAITG